MGGKLTRLENRTHYNIEMKIWVHPSRPDRFEKIIRINPASSVKIKAKLDGHHDRLESGSVLIMVCTNGSWTGNCIFPHHLMTYAKVICDRNQHGQVILRGTRANFNFCRLKCFAFCPAKCVGLGMVEEDI